MCGIIAVSSWIQSGYIYFSNPFQEMNPGLAPSAHTVCVKSSRRLWWCCIKDSPRGLAANSKEKLYCPCVMNVLTSPCPFCALLLLLLENECQILNSWRAEIESKVYKWLWTGIFQRNSGVVKLLGVPGVLWQHEDIRGPISPKYQTILSLQDCSVLLSFLYQNKTRFDLKEVMDSAAGATGWVWGIGF